MKKYITLAALLAAGTTFANAETLTTTFGTANQSSVADVELSVEGLEGVTADVVSLVNSAGNVSIKTAGTAGTDAAIFSPDTNVGTGAPWTAEFKYTLGGTVEVKSLQSIGLDVVLFNSSGAYQQGGQWAAVWEGSITFTATILDENDLELGSFGGSLIPKQGQGSTPFTVSLSSASAVDLSSTDSFTMKLALTETLDNGTFVGLKTIKQEVSVVPEPSAFGMLAGLGALALVASRRRRK
ncbi:MAG: PEP-CTERM sorting domain-containing protein [Verrucomicrobia bacterium]|nr:PEP-CTERM sorting domain-containing protein [Verrucomicrobiota bacterium]